MTQAFAKNLGRNLGLSLALIGLAAGASFAQTSEDKRHSLAQSETSDKPSPGDVIILGPDEIETVDAKPVLPPDPELASPEAERTPAYQNPRYRRLATPQFETFGSAVEYRRLLRDITRLNGASRTRRLGAATGDQIVVAALQDTKPAGPEIDECAIPEDCPDVAEDTRYIVVSGSRIATSQVSVATPIAAVGGDSITNTQVASVDEGDIIKLIGEYLLVLQDGRIFAVHYPTMRLTDLQDVYRTNQRGRPIGADWYDEMLVQGDQIIVTAYSYEDDASEITVLRLDQETGLIEPRGVFLISSDDYYDVDNYATRLVGDKLVIHTPYRADDLVSRRDRPVIRRWTNAEDFYDNEAADSQILDVRDIYRPIFGVSQPWVHSISVCPLGEVIDRGLRCETTAFMASDHAEMYVTPEAAYLWSSALGYGELNWNACEARTPEPEFGEVPPAVIYRVPLGRGEVEILGARGIPNDQFAMDATATRFRALSLFYRHACSDELNPKSFALMNASLGQFRDRYVPARESEFTRLPALWGNAMENRFTGDMIVYGGRPRYSRRPLRGPSVTGLATRLYAVPIDNPEQAQEIALGHTMIRLERMGSNAVMASGYAGGGGLRVSYVGFDPDNADNSGVRSSAYLVGRYESESRSHAFNATYTAQGNGMLGIPTVLNVDNSDGYWWYSDVSDLSFLGFGAQGQLSDAGVILATPEDEVETGEGYQCEVSCIDWYGNARPIFLGGKVYGLMATEIVEAEVIGGSVTERRRVDLTGAIGAAK